MLTLFLIHQTNTKYRSTLSLFIYFSIGLVLYVQVSDYFISSASELSKETKVLLNRCLLLCMIIGVCISLKLSKQKINFFTSMPNWKERIVFPHHTLPTRTFFLFGLLGSMTIFIPLFFKENIALSTTFLMFALLFSLINALLEELLWRGVLLSSLKENISTPYAVVTTSIGFGLLHLSIGIPFVMSLLFSLGGLFYAFVVLKTNSIYPAIVFHFVINMGMVLNEWII
ncbi:CPBP family intramembrane glutamic endopeptidase [Bacillus sp. E(2018)]|uniref:CPBP family intramembrane glutamic endopeptidase n=1 Tax=Bacillus sp. E(2018) TaxID=2502239 RepID=UPI0025710DD1|nr:CPBP family intramembrane glutamic endopeptidase [Bacillus sp. E(2018)]